MFVHHGYPVDSLKFDAVSVFATNEAGDSVPLLEDIRLSLTPGEWLNMVGVNGSGKTTLARLLAGLHMEGRSGTIFRGFAGEPASPVVLQRPEAQLFGETPREEIMFALEWRQVPSELMESRITHSLSVTGLQELADWRWDRLSGGQRQLAAVAAAAAVGSPLLVFDEATSMLDETNRQAVLGLAKDLHRDGTTIVWVTQRLDELQPDHRVAAIAGGRITYDGDVRTFMYGQTGDERTPCEASGLRLPYLAELALQMFRKGKLSRPLPVTGEEWREVWAIGGRGADRDG